jgi:hypothetical protein
MSEITKAKKAGGSKGRGTALSSNPSIAKKTKGIQIGKE